MNMINVGRFLAELRKEKGYTQEKLGEILGVTNKTVSRWETGIYLPPVDILLLLSEEYGVSINEILSGKRLSDNEYREKAEDNLKTAISGSIFTVREKIEYYKKKWIKNNLFIIIPVVLLISFLWILSIVFFNPVRMFVPVLYFFIYMYFHNKMAGYIEDRIYGNQDNG